jgi:hypothetical protein
MNFTISNVTNNEIGTKFLDFHEKIKEIRVFLRENQNPISHSDEEIIGKRVISVSIRIDFQISELLLIICIADAIEKRAE